MRVHGWSPQHRARRRAGHGQNPCGDRPRSPAIEHHRRKVRFFSTIELVNALSWRRPEARQGRLPRRCKRFDLLILDELGYLPFSASVSIAHHLLSKPYERTSVVITTNLSFSEWANGLRRRKDDDCSTRPPDSSLPYPGNRKRQLPLQGQLGCRSTEERKSQTH